MCSQKSMLNCDPHVVIVATEYKAEKTVRQLEPGGHEWGGGGWVGADGFQNCYFMINGIMCVANSKIK